MLDFQQAIRLYEQEGGFSLPTSRIVHATAYQIGKARCTTAPHQRISHILVDLPLQYR